MVKTKVSVFQDRLINLHNELGTVRRNAESMPTTGEAELHAVLDRYGMPGLKDVLEL